MLTPESNRSSAVIIAILMILTSFVSVNARIIHVAVDGNDTTGDGSENNPFASIQHSISQICRYDDPSPGDTIFVHEGTYPDIPRSGGYPVYGEYGTYVYIMGVPGEDKPVLAGEYTAGFTSMHSGDTPPHNFALKRLIFDRVNTNPGSRHDINLYAWEPGDYPDPVEQGYVHNVIIDSCEFYNDHYTGECIKMAGVDSYTIRNCYFTGRNEHSMMIGQDGCHYGEIYNNILENCNMGGIQFKGGCFHSVVRNNVIRNCNFTGLNFGGDMDAGLCRPPIDLMESPPFEARNIEAYSNFIIDCRIPVAFNGSRNCKFYNNIVIQEDPRREDGTPYETPALIWFRRTSGTWEPTPPRDHLISNNIFYYHTIRYGYQNIFFQNPVSEGGEDDLYASTIKFHHNAWYCFEDPDESFKNWTNEDRWNMVDTLNNVFGDNPGLVENLETSLRIPTNSALLAWKGMDMEPPLNYEYRDFFGEMYSTPPPIGPVNLTTEPGDPPSNPVLMNLLPAGDED